MSAADGAAETELAILWRLIHPDRRNFSAATARSILEIDFEPGDIERMNELAEKARRGILTPSEESAIDNYELVGHLLALLHAKARRTLSERKRARSVDESPMRLVWERAGSRCEYCQLPRARR